MYQRRKCFKDDRYKNESSDRNILVIDLKIKLIHIHKIIYVNYLSHEDFKVSYDWSRAIFSPDVDHQYICAGSADGSVFIWNSATAKVEKILKEHK